MKIPTHTPQTRQDNIVILRSADGKPLTKKHRWVGNAWRTTLYGNAYLFTPSTKPLESLADLSAILTQLEHDKTACVVRGALREPDNTQPIRRKLHGESAALTKRDRFWVAFDLDDIPAPAWLEPHDADSLRKAVRYAITTTLPAAFHEAACFYSWTSSAGVNGWETLNLRLWFWGDRPICDDSLREAFGKGRSAVDASLFNAVQIHYTAAPVFEGIPDPLAGVRSGTLEGSQVVTFPAYLLSQSDHDAKREMDKPQHVEAVEIIEAQSGDVRRRLEREVDSVRERIESAGVGGRHAAILRGATRLAELTKAGYLTRTQALSILDKAASEALHGESGRDGEAANAFAWAMNTVKPRYLKRPVEAVEVPDTAHSTKESARDEVSAWVSGCVERGGVFVLKAAVGAGKSHAAIHAAVGAALEGKKVAYLTPSLDLGEKTAVVLEEQFRAREPESFFAGLSNPVWLNRTRTRDNCGELKTYVTGNNKDGESGTFFCESHCPKHPKRGGKCPFVLQGKDSPGSLITVMTHEAFVMKYASAGSKRVVVSWSQIGELAGEPVLPVLKTTANTNTITVKEDANGIVLNEIDYVFNERGDKKYTPTDAQRIDTIAAIADFLFVEHDPHAIADALSEDGNTQAAFDLIIVDEGIENTLASPVSMTIEQFMTLRRAGGLMIEDAALGRLVDVLTRSNEADAQGRYQSFGAGDVRVMVGADFLTVEANAGEVGKRAGTQHRAVLNGGGSIDAALKALEIAPDLKALDALRDEVARGFTTLSIAQGEIRLINVRRVEWGRLGRVVLALDATTTPEIARACYGEGAEFKQIDIVKPSSLHVINIDKAMAKGRVRAGEWQSDYARALFERVHNHYDSPHTLHVLPGKTDWLDQAADSEISQSLDMLEGAKLYPNAGASRGSNAFEHCHTVVIDSFYVPKYAKEAKAKGLCLLAGDEWGATQTDWLEQSEYLLEIAPQIQLIGRIRPLNSTEQNPKTIVMFDGEKFAKYSNLLTVNESLKEHALQLRFAVENSKNSVVWFKDQKTRKPAWNKEWSSCTHKTSIYIDGKYGQSDHSSIDAGFIDFEGIRKNFVYSSENVEKYALAAGVKVVRVSTSKGGAGLTGYHLGFDTEQERDKLTKIGYDESWTWFEFEGKRVYLDYFEEWLFDALAQPDELPETAVEVYDLIGEFMNKSRSYVQRRLKAAGMTIADVRNMFETINMFEDVSGGHYETPADDIADEAYEHAVDDLVERGWAIRELRADYKKYARSERTRAWYTPHSFKNPYPEPLPFRCWLLDIWLPKYAPTELESLNALRVKEVAQ